MSVAENVKRLRDIFNITQKELAEVAGVTENAVSKWENDYAEPRMGAIKRICTQFGLSKYHLIEEGGMEFVDPLTKKATYPPDALMKTIQPIRTDTAYAPLLGRIHAGIPQEPDEIEEVIALPSTIFDAHPNGYFLEVEGDCMSCIYPEGCFIFIDPDKQPQNGSIAAVRIDTYEVVMRRLYRGADTMILSPDSYNPEHRDIVITADSGQTIELVGTVVWYQSSKELE